MSLRGKAEIIQKILDLYRFAATSAFFRLSGISADNSSELLESGVLK
jgi:hypothetical protein